MVVASDESYTRENVRIASKTPGIRLDAWLYKPDKKAGDVQRLPIILIAHGFAGRKSYSLQGFGKAFANSGRLAVVFDYRTWGASEGVPRDTLDLQMQIDDYKSVLEWAKKRDDVDPTKVVLWGTSFSGGHVSKIASEIEVAGAIAQCPCLDAIPSIFRVSSLSVARLVPFAIYDMVARYILPSVLPPLYVQALGPPGSLSMLSSIESPLGHVIAAFTRDETEDNVKAEALHALSGHDFLDFSTPGEPRMRPSSLIELLQTRPITSAHNIKCPYLVLIGEEDVMVSAKASLKAVQLSLKGEAHFYKGGHFNAYPSFGEHERMLKLQLDFLDRIL